MKHLMHTGLLLAALAGGLAATAPAQVGPSYRVQDYAVHSGLHGGAGADARLALEHVVRVPGAAWMRLLLDDAELGRASWIALHAPRAGATQHLDARSLADWNLGTALFAGDTVNLQLWVAPADRDVFFSLERVVVGLPAEEGGYQNLCGGDSRGPSGDNRVGRLPGPGCTAWRITNGAFLTAGHCVDFDPDCAGGTNGPLVPDGVLDLMGVVEFNAPTSACQGDINPALPEDQYPIDTSSVVWRYDGCGEGIGKDWAVFGVNPNSETGLLPHEVYGFPLRVSREIPSLGSTIRITGFGADATPPGCTGRENSDSQTNQTSTGDFRGELVVNANWIQLEYGTDSMGGNSGGPVIWESVNLAIGIHTNGGCGGTNPGDQGNFATSCESNELEAAIHGFTSGGTARFVDAGHPRPGGFEDGGIYRPWDKVVDALTSPVSGQVVSIAAGSYTAASGHVFTITTPMTLEAPVGAVTIGN